MRGGAQKQGAAGCDVGRLRLRQEGGGVTFSWGRDGGGSALVLFFLFFYFLAATWSACGSVAVLETVADCVGWLVRW